MKVKICGLKSIEDSLVACHAGADMLGYNFYKPSPRYLSINLCRQIVEEVKKEFPSVICVGVFVNHSVEQINKIISETGLDLAQLSGDEPPETLSNLGQIGFQALRPQSFKEVERIVKMIPDRINPPDFLLDSHQKGSYGGSGSTGDWELAAKIAKQYPVLLAGGLDPENVVAAITKVKPWGVDVASGVESQRGIKDADLIKTFIHHAKTAVNMNLN